MLNFIILNHHIINYMDILDQILLEHKILETHNGKISVAGRFAGEEKNKYWFVKNIESNEEYYIMDCSGKIVKISIESLDKVIGISNSWYLCPNGFIAANINKKQIHMHSYIMDHVGYGNTKDSEIVLHINHDKLDNRRSNLILVSHSEQKRNRKKCKRRIDAKPLPDGIEQSDLPKYVTYNVEYKKNDEGEKVMFRDYFRIEKHPTQNGKMWTTSKSKQYTIRQKLQEAIAYLQILNNQDNSTTDNQVNNSVIDV